MKSTLESLFKRRLLRRVGLGLSANALGKIWILLVQLITVPVLVSRWGPNDYGVWLMLSAVPTYVALSDLGFGIAGSIDMTKRVALGDRSGALMAFQSVWCFISGISVALLIFALLIFAIWYRLNISEGLGHQDILWASIVLLLYSIFSLQTNVVNIGFRSTGRYAQGTFFIDLLIPIESMALLVIASGGGHFAAASSGLLAIRMLGGCYYYRLLRRAEPWLKFGVGAASYEEIRILAKPAFAALTFPISTALNIQGVVFVLGIAVSPVVAATYGTMRMLSRVPLQLVATFTRATLPELTMAHALKDVRTWSRLVLANLLAVGVISLPASGVLVLYGPFALKLLTHGKMNAGEVVFLFVATITLLQTLWNTIGQFMFSLNLQHRFSHLYAGISITAVVVSFFVAQQSGLIGVLAILVVVDSIMAMIVTITWLRSDDTAVGCLRELVQRLGRIAKIGKANV